jgi:superfamily II DNA/RNA helicase
VDDVTHVVNYECPDDEKTYLHRIGRTGRAGRAGVAVTFVDWRDMQRWKLINDALGIGQPEPAETYSTSEHLFTDLCIAPDASGSLPRELRGARAGLAAEAEEDLGETGRTRSRRRAPGGRSRRSRSRHPDDGTNSRNDDAPSKKTDAAGGPGDSTESRAPRRRRRTRGGRDLTQEAAAESASTVPQESAQQAS